MPEFQFDIKVDGKHWSRKAEVGSLKGAQMLCSYTERLFEIVGISARCTVREIEVKE